MRGEDGGAVENASRSHGEELAPRGADRSNSWLAKVTSRWAHCGPLARRRGCHARSARTRPARAALLDARRPALDMDVLGVACGPPDNGALGHRGASHSLITALAIGLLSALVARRFGWPVVRTAVAATLALASHGILDACGEGGRGIPLLWPLTDTRFMSPWRLLPDAPRGLAMLSGPGCSISASSSSCSSLSRRSRCGRGEPPRSCGGACRARPRSSPAGPLRPSPPNLSAGDRLTARASVASRGLDGTPASFPDLGPCLTPAGSRGPESPSARSRPSPAASRTSRTAIRARRSRPAAARIRPTTVSGAARPAPRAAGMTAARPTRAQPATRRRTPSPRPAPGARRRPSR